MTAALVPVDCAAAARSQMAAFAAHASAATGLDLGVFENLHRWACRDTGTFWRLFLDWADLQTSGSVEPPIEGRGVEDARFFPGLRLNYTRNLLGRSGRTGVAIVERRESGRRHEASWESLTRRALATAAALRAEQVLPGDRVAALARNAIETVEACLGAAAVGAPWCSVALDLGTEAVLSRFAQLEPVVLFAHTDTEQQGVTRAYDAHVAAVADALPSLRTLVVLGGPMPVLSRRDVDVIRYDEWCDRTPTPLEALVDFPFDHPLFVLFSSGTTGPPKCIVHGAGGTLLEHVKEHRLHTDLGPRDRLYFHTSCGWMMWNWQLTALASGTSVVLYEGSPTWPDAAALLRLLDEERVTVFGTSPGYVQLLRGAGVEPGAHGRFDDLRAIQSTGSVLYPDQFEWLHAHVKAVPIQSISGGTDIIGCFVLGNPLVPVHAGESQSVSLGMDVRAMTPDGPVVRGRGELVCLNPFPSRPVGIWNDDSRERFRATYFDENPGVWTHGDAIELTERGSARILGRSDGTMKIRGVRIGPAELYAVVLTIPGVREAIAVEQRDPDEPGGSRLVLLVVLAPDVELDRDLTWRIKRELSRRASPLHVPSVIVPVSALPQTLNGKYSERAARDVLNGSEVVNRQALRNPAVLDELRAHPLLRRT